MLLQNQAMYGFAAKVISAGSGLEKESKPEQRGCEEISPVGQKGGEAELAEAVLSKLE